MMLNQKGIAFIPLIIWVGLILIGINLLGNSKNSNEGGQHLSQAENYREVVNNDNILIKINEARLAMGLPQLKVDEQLVNYAQARAAEINYNSILTHQSNLKFQNYANHFSDFGEILFSGGKTSSVVVDGWLNSPTHKDLMLNKNIDSVGVYTLVYNPKLRNIVVVEFGKIYVQPSVQYVPYYNDVQSQLPIVQPQPYYPPVADPDYNIYSGIGAF